MSESENETKGFKVTDRRKFTADGDPRSEEEKVKAEAKTAESVPKDPPPESSEEPSDPDPVETDAGEAESPRPSGPPPEVGFMDLVSMLVSNALMQLGDLPDPVSGESAENLPGVQVMIGFLAMLQEKTKGNLSSEEDKILENALYDLRMRFMTKANLIQS
jgi:hypothetical protein